MVLTYIIQKESLERQVADRKDKIKRIDSIYTSAFSGPTPGIVIIRKYCFESQLIQMTFDVTDFPEDDAAEDELKEAEHYYDNVRASDQAINQRRGPSWLLFFSASSSSAAAKL